jgi:hypothetical protein
MKLRATKLLHNQISDPGRLHHELMMPMKLRSTTRTPKADEAKGNKTAREPVFVPEQTKPRVTKS